jgi:hypothetical protein
VHKALGCLVISAFIELRAGDGQRVGELLRVLDSAISHGDVGLSTGAPAVQVLFPLSPESVARVPIDLSRVQRRRQARVCCSERDKHLKHVLRLNN